MKYPQTSDTTKVGQYKRRTYKRRTSTNVGLVQTSDEYKRRTSTNVGLVQTSDQYKRRTSTFIRKNVGLMVDFEWTIVLKSLIKNPSLLMIKIKDN